MYNTNYVSSGLLTGTQWDVMINKINSVDSTKSLTNSTWGNYQNQTFTYNGKIASNSYTTAWYITAFGNYIKNGTKPTITGNAGYLLTTRCKRTSKII